ncbi:MAG: hypothetical protein AAF502_12950 [Bacteroidota bacterium]
MRPLVSITMCVVFLLPICIFAQTQSLPEKPQTPRLTEKVIIKQQSQVSENIPENVVTTNARPIRGPVMRTATQPKSTIQEQIQKFEKQLEGMTPAYKAGNPQIVENLEAILKRKRSELSLLQKNAEKAPSN